MIIDVHSHVPSLLSLVVGAGFEPTSLGSRLKAVLIYHIAQNDELFRQFSARCDIVCSAYFTSLSKVVAT